MHFQGAWRALRLLLVLSGASSLAAGGFVRVQGGSFVKDGCAMRIAAYNTYNSVDAFLDGAEARAKNLLDRAQRSNFQAVRTFAFPVNPDKRLITGFSTFNETVLAAVDRLIAEAKRRDMLVVLVLANHWQGSGSTLEYMNLAAPGAESRKVFYQDARLKGMYRSFVQTILTRRNTVTGIPYRREEAIAAIELMNEPRAPSVASLRSWVEEMAAHVRRVDPYHIISIGIEGFFSDTSTPGRKRLVEATAGDITTTGQDFVTLHRFVHPFISPCSFLSLMSLTVRRNELHRVPNIDFATLHLWPDNWFFFERGNPPLSRADEVLQFTRAWIEEHMREAREFLNMPVLVEEYGKADENAFGDKELGTREDFKKARAALYRAVHSTLRRALRDGDPVGGAAFWVFLDESDPATKSEPFTVLYDSDLFQDVIAEDYGVIGRSC